MRTPLMALLVAHACGWALAQPRMLAAQEPPISRCDSLREQFPDGGTVMQPAEPFPGKPVPVLPDSFVARNDTVIARFIVDYWGYVQAGTIKRHEAL